MQRQQQRRQTQSIEEGIPTVEGLLALRGDTSPPRVAGAHPSSLTQAQSQTPATAVTPIDPTSPTRLRSARGSAAAFQHISTLSSIADTLRASDTSTESGAAPPSVPGPHQVLPSNPHSQLAPPSAPDPAPSSALPARQTFTPPTTSPPLTSAVAPKPDPTFGAAEASQVDAVASSQAQAQTSTTTSVQAGEFPHLKGILYCSESMPLPQGMKEEWFRNGGLKSKIDDELSKISTNHAIFNDLVMASRSNDQAHLKPSVVITCVSKEIRDEIKGRLQPFLGRRVVPQEYKLRILIDKNAGTKADVLPQSSQPKSWPSNASPQSLPTSGDQARRPSVLVPRPSSPVLVSQPGTAFEGGSPDQVAPLYLSNRRTAELGFRLMSSEASPSTFCGLGIDRSVGSRSIDATFGGIICVDGKLFGLTTGHLFASVFPPLSASLPPESEEGSSMSYHEVLDDSSSGDSVLPPNRAPSDDGPSGPPNRPLSPIVSFQPEEEAASSTRSAAEYRLRMTNGYGVAGAFAGNYFVTTSFKNAAGIKYHQHKCMDWALLELPETDRLPANNCPGRENIPIEHSAVEEDLTPGPVTLITCKSGVLRGYLSEANSSMTLTGHQYEVRRIGLSKTLERGDSGAWVIRDRTLCGIVIAGGGLLPWAYMLSIEKIFTEIKMLLGVQDVRVPKADEINLIRSNTPLPRQQPRPSEMRVPETKSWSAKARESPHQDDDSITHLPPQLKAAYTPRDLHTVYSGFTFDLDLPGGVVTDVYSPNSFLPTFGTDTGYFPRSGEQPQTIRLSDLEVIGLTLYTELVPTHLRVAKKLLASKSSRQWPAQPPLHAQAMLGRSLVITEDPHMHMVLYKSRLFMKPLPLYVTSWQRWLNHNVPDRQDIDRGALAMVWSYVTTVRYPSDLRIATDAGLLPGMPWENWKMFAQQVLKEAPQILQEIEPFHSFSVVTLDELCDIDTRFFAPFEALKDYYTAYRRRMTSTVRLLRQDSVSTTESVDPEPQPSKTLKLIKAALSYNSITFPLMLVFSLILCLLAFLTGLHGDILSKKAAFQRASYGFVVFCLVTGALLILSSIYLDPFMGYMASRGLVDLPKGDFRTKIFGPFHDQPKTEKEKEKEQNERSSYV